MNASETLTALMDKARNITGLTEKISVPRLVGLIDHFDLRINPNLIAIDDFGPHSPWRNGASYKAEPDWNGLKVVSATNTSTNRPIHSGINKRCTVESGKTYTFSIYAKASVENFGASFNLTYGHDDEATLDVANNYPITINKSWQRYSLTFTAQKGGTINPRVESDTPGTLYLAGYKLEVGDLATPLQKVGGVVKALLCALTPVRGCAA